MVYSKMMEGLLGRAWTYERTSLAVWYAGRAAKLPQPSFGGHMKRLAHQELIIDWRGGGPPRRGSRRGVGEVIFITSSRVPDQHPLIRHMCSGTPSIIS